MADLFDDRAMSGPHTLAGAPDTSHAAAATIAPRCPALRERVANLAASFRGGFIDDDLYPLMVGELETSVRKRRCELSQANIILDSGCRRVNPNGNPAVLWVHRAFVADAPPVQGRLKKPAKLIERESIVDWLRDPLQMALPGEGAYWARYFAARIEIDIHQTPAAGAGAAE